MESLGIKLEDFLLKSSVAQPVAIFNESDCDYGEPECIFKGTTYEAFKKRELVKYHKYEIMGIGTKLDCNYDEAQDLDNYLFIYI